MGQGTGSHELSTQPIQAMTTAEIRELDRRAIQELGIPGIVLMENAGAGAARVAREMLGKGLGPVVVLAGPGNNGGDGYVVARHLANAGVSVVVYLFAAKEKVGGDARTNLEIIRKMRIPIASAENAEFGELERQLSVAVLIVDALLGTGTTGEVRPPIREVIEMANRSKRRVLALDIPSGLHPDTGEVLGAAIRATVTATFLTPKLGFTKKEGPKHTGRLAVCDIGIVPSMIPGKTERI